MNKRILSILLTLCMLITLVPMALYPASAEENVQTGSTSSSEGSTATSYKDLYVGIGGSQTENGGVLSIFMSAFKGDSSVDLSNGRWNNTAKGASNYATFGGNWITLENGGVTYAGEQSSFDYSYMLSLDASLLPTDNYTLEIVSSVRGLTGASAFAQTANMSLGALRTYLWSGYIESKDWKDPRNNNALVMMATDAATTTEDKWSPVGVASGHWNNCLLAYRNDATVNTLAISYTSSATVGVYKVAKNASDITPEKNTYEKTNPDFVGKFIINRAMPATFYAVRLYTKPLTNAELAHNAGVDILLYVGADFSVYKNLADDAKKDFLAAVAAEGFDVTIDEIEEIAENIAAIAEVAREKRKMSEYDKMYIGADGSKTQNGGKLTVLLSSYTLNSVLLTEGQNVWMDKMGNHNATFVGPLWTTLEGGGVGYDMTILADGTGGNYQTDVRLNLGIDALPVADYTVETVAFYDYIKIVDASGKQTGESYKGDAWWNGVVSDAVGQLKAVYERGGGTTLGGAHYARYFLAPGTDGWYKGNYLNNKLHSETSRDATGVYTQQIVRDITVTATNTLATYSLMKNGALTKTGDFASDGAVSVWDSATNKAIQGNKYYAEDGSETAFYLFNRAPVDVYAIRIYDAVLTEYEIAYNHFVDFLAYAEVDLSIIENLSAEERAALIESLATASLISDKAKAETAIAETLSFYVNTFDKDTTLYVTDGLTILLASYDGFSTATRFGESEVLWANAVNEGTYGTLMGRNWYRSEDGGIMTRDTATQAEIEAKNVKPRPNKGDDFYLTFDYSMLPDGDYTLETILAPEGITQASEEGELTRYYDDYSTYGIFYDRAFVLGAFRSMGFACFSHVADGNMQRRWMYQTKGGWNGSDRNHVGTDNVFAEVGVGEIVNYSILHDYQAEESETVASLYTILYNGTKGTSISIKKEMYIANADVVDKHFDVWRGLASTMYSVRMYDRILTEAERLQNHVADVCYYFDLDISMLQKALSSIPDKATVFSAFAHLSFDMTKEEAQLALDSGMAGVWIQADGVGVKQDMSDAIRFYFNLQYGSLAAIMNAGFAVEVGVMVNVGTNEVPVLENAAYDYRFVVFDSVFGANAKYFLDEDTVAITLSYMDATTELYNEAVKISTYVKLVDASGNVTYFYGGLMNNAYADNTSLFTVYDYLATTDAIIENGFSDYLTMIAKGCYQDIIIYFDSYANGEGDGSASAPYTDFTDAFEACKDVLVNMTAPTNLVLLIAGGIHHLDEIYEFDFEEVTFSKYAFSIEGDLESEEASELTTVLDIPASAFEALEGHNGIYVFEFEPDSEGNYPKFRNLYVDGWSATMAHTTPTTTANGEFPSLSRFDRDVDGTFIKAEYYYDNGDLLDHAPAVEYADCRDRTDLIASYTKHYEWFLALKDLKAIYQLDGFESLTAEGVRPGMGSDYSEAFAHFHAEFAKVKKGEIKASSVDYTVSIDIGSRGVLYLNLDAVGILRDTVNAKIAEMKAAGTYIPGESQKSTLAGMGIELHATAEWDYDIIDIAGIDFDDAVYYYDERHKAVETLVAVYMDPAQYEKFEIPVNANRVTGYFSMANRHVFVSNAFEFLDTTGEYYYDIEEGKLYYYSEYGIDDLVFSYPTMDNMFIFHNTRNLTVSDLTFWGVDDYTMTETGLAAAQAGANRINSTTNVSLMYRAGFTERAALAMYDAYFVTIQDCYFHDIGGAAIYIEGRVEDTTISGNEIEMIGDSGIRIRGDRAANNEFSSRSGAERVTITQNYLHQIAQSTYNAPALYLASCKDVEIANNTIIGCSYSGMSIGWSWSAASWEEHDKYNLYNVNIHHNYITDFMQNLGDGGAIYMLGGNLKPDNPKQINFIHHNCVIFSDTSGNGLGQQSDGYYFDGSSTNWSNYNNVLVEQSAGADRGAKENANDRDYALYMRRKGSHFFFKQYTTTGSAWSYNIHSSDNFVFNVRATTAAAQQKEVFFMGTDAHWQKCGHKVTGTRYFSGTSKLAFPESIKRLIEETGARMHPGEWEWLMDNEY